MLAILAKQKETVLPLYLGCITALDYNTDRTESVLRAWIARCGHDYASVELDATEVSEPVERHGVDQSNASRFRVLGRIRGASMRRAAEQACDFYFVADVDNFLRPCTLRELVALDLPIVASLLRSIRPGGF